MLFILPLYSTRTGYRLFALLLLISAFALRVWALDAHSFWFDEAFEYWAATTDLINLPETVRIVLNDPPLYTLMLHFWIKVGEEVFTQRYLSVLVSLLGVVGVMLIGYRLSGRFTALVAALIMTVLPSQIRYAQDAGQYVWLSSFLVWNVIALLSIIRTDKGSRYLWWIGTALVASYTYYGAVFTIVATTTSALVEWIRARDWPRLRRCMLAISIYVLGILPLMIYFLPKQMFRGPTANAFVIQIRPLLQELQIAWTTTMELVAFQFTGWPWTAVPLWLTSVIVWPLFVLAFHPSTPAAGRRIGIWLIVTWAIYYIIGYLRIYPYTYRYGLILTPLLIPILAQGIANLSVLPKAQWIKGLTLAAILMICLVSLPNRPVRDFMFPGTTWPWPEIGDLGSITETWLNNRDSDTPTYVYYAAVPPFRYYLKLLNYEAEDLPPTWIQDCYRTRQNRPAYCESANVYYSSWNRNQSDEQKTQEVLDFVLDKGDKFWLVFAHVHHQDDQRLLENLSSSYTVIQHHAATGTAIYLLQRR
jgi:hypothetical protein